MIAFVLTRKGYAELVEFAGRLPDGSWVNAGVLSVEEIAEIRKNSQLTTFTRYVDVESADEVSAALATIREHYPGESIWVEAAWVEAVP